MSTKILSAGLTIRARGDEPEITITAPTRDLMNDTIDPMGMDVAGYLNGTRAVSFAHDHSSLPVAKTLTLAKSSQGIRAKFTWLGHHDAQEVRGVFDAGVLGASVEFVPVASEPNRDGGMHFAKSILSGWSLTGNPANQSCTRMLKSLGLWRQPVDEIDLAMLSRADVLAALHEGIGALAQDQATAAVTRERWKLMGGGEHVLVLDDEIEVGLTAEDVLAALRSSIGAEVEAGVRRAINGALGRVD